MERVDITIDYNLPADEFAALPQNFPTGNYHEGGEDNEVKWYRVEIDSPNGTIKLTWFLE